MFGIVIGAIFVAEQRFSLSVIYNEEVIVENMFMPFAERVDSHAWPRPPHADGIAPAARQIEVNRVREGDETSVGSLNIHLPFKGLEFRPGSTVIWRRSTAMGAWRVTRALLCPKLLSHQVRICVMNMNHPRNISPCRRCVKFTTQRHRSALFSFVHLSVSSATAIP